MHRLSGAVGSVVGKARKMAHRGPSDEERRETFYREFGQYPPNFEAPQSERERFGREVVRPVLTQRAQAVRQAEQDRVQNASSPSVEQTKGEAEAAFAHAYALAVGLKVAKKGQTYQDYLGSEAS
ncbi:MAG: hypothetical protein ACRDJW_23505 [Thermomicrobiales bacterium]